MQSVKDMDKKMGTSFDSGQKQAQDLAPDQIKSKPESEARKLPHLVSTSEQTIDLKDAASEIHADSRSESPSRLKVAETAKSQNTPVEPADTEQKEPSPSDPKSLKYTIIRSTSLKCLQSGSTTDLLFPEITLGDWGAASWKEKHLTRIIQPVALRAPEVLIEAPWDFTTDLWNLGAVVFESLCNVQLFRGIVYPPGRYELKRHLEEIVDVFGPFPKSLLEQGNKEIVENMFNKDGTVKDAQLIPRVPLDSLEYSFWAGLSSWEVKEFLHFLRALMKVDPKERKLVNELLDEPWLEDLFM